MQLTAYTDKHRAAWSRFLASSGNGTLFHSHDFLDYHPPGRFAWRHPIFGNPDEPFAVLPGAVQVDTDGGATYRSPSGATLGGPVVRRQLGFFQTLELVQTLIAYGRDAGWKSIALGTVPPIYWAAPDDSLEFALRDAGFVPTPQLMFYVPLRGVGPGRTCSNFARRPNGDRFASRWSKDSKFARPKRPPRSPRFTTSSRSTRSPMAPSRFTRLRNLCGCDSIFRSRFVCSVRSKGGRLWPGSTTLLPPRAWLTLNILPIARTLAVWKPLAS